MATMNGDSSVIRITNSITFDNTLSYSAYHVKMYWISTHRGSLTNVSQFSILNSCYWSIITRTMHHDMSTIFSHLTIFIPVNLNIST
jgi:hypothetical protein